MVEKLSAYVKKVGGPERKRALGRCRCRREYSVLIFVMDFPGSA
jgi:hypothetical protein